MRPLPFVTLCALGASAGCYPDNLEPNPGRPANPALPAPTVTATRDTVPAAADALIRTSARHSNHGGAQTMMVKITRSQDDTTRVVIKFDQAAIAAAIGSGTLTRASLELGIEQSGTESENRIDVHRILLSWTEFGVTWRCGDDLNTANTSADCPTTKWRMSGADMDAFVALRTDRAHLAPGQTGVAKFNVTADLQAFLGGAANHGWLVTAADPTSRVVVWSRETAMKPRLVLNIQEEEPVPEQAPELIPEWMYSDTNVVDGSDAIAAPFTKRIVVVQFTPEATLADRKAAVASVGGEVVGGVPIPGGEGQYYLRVADQDGALLAAKAEGLRAMPRVASAFVNVAGEDQWRVPDDGDNWKTANWAVVPRLINSLAFTYAQTAINAPMAWGCVTGESPTPVAVVDVDFRVGSVDQSLFKDLQGMSRRTRAPMVLDTSSHAHGAGIAGLLGAKGNNGEGMTGMLWDADVRLYDYSIHQTPTNVAWRARWASPIAAEVQHAAYDGARVINVSSGINWKKGKPIGQGTSSQRRARDEMTWALRGALQTMAARGYRPLVVVSAGNDGVDAEWNGFPLVRDAFPDQILSVGGSAANNTLMNDGPGAISNTGRYVDIVAPGSQVATFTETGDVAPASSGTSLAAPLVSGIAGLVLSFDSTLTTAEVRQFIVDGAVRANRTITKDGHTYYVADAYEAVKMAAERRGNPLCGNRIWANGGQVFASRATGPEPLFAPDGGERGVFALAAHHGGREIDMIPWSGPDRTFKLQGSQWLRSPEVPDLFANQSGVANSLWGLSHDGKQEVFLDYTLVSTARIVRMQLYDSTGAIKLTDLDAVLPQLQQYPETTCAWRTRGSCGGIGRGTDDQYMLPWAVAYSPVGDHAVLAISVRRTIATFNGDWKPCAWSVPDPETEEPSDECLDSITYETLPVKAYLYDYPLPTGPRRLITTLENTVVNSVAISEDGAQMVVNEGMKYEKFDAMPPGPEGCSPVQPGVFGFCTVANRTELTSSCMITYRSVADGEVIEPRIPAVYACELPVASMGSVKAKSARPGPGARHRP